MSDFNSYYIFNDERPIIIFDAGALIAGIDLSQIGIENLCITSYDVLNEIRNRFVKDKINSFISNGTLKSIEAPSFFIKKAKIIAKESGDLNSLSENDIGIIGVTLFIRESYSKQFNLEYGAIQIKLITDDFSVLNVASISGIKNEAFKMKGIKKSIIWEIYCPACFKVYSSINFGKSCEVCGEIIKRRPLKNKR